jgi:hypothetical protein
MVPTLDAATVLQGQSSVKVLQTQDLAYSLIGLNDSRPRSTSKRCGRP